MARLRKTSGNADPHKIKNRKLTHATRQELLAAIHAANLKRLGKNPPPTQATNETA